MEETVVIGKRPQQKDTPLLIAYIRTSVDEVQLYYLSLYVVYRGGSPIDLPSIRSLTEGAYDLLNGERHETQIKS